MTTTAAPQNNVPFPVCFIFHGDGPTSHRRHKDFIDLTQDQNRMGGRPTELQHNDCKISDTRGWENLKH